VNAEDLEVFPPVDDLLVQTMSLVASVRTTIWLGAMARNRLP